MAKQLMKDVLAKATALAAWLAGKTCQSPCTKTTSGPAVVMHIDPVNTDPLSCPAPPSPTTVNFTATQSNNTSCATAEDAVRTNLATQLKALPDPCGAGCSRYASASGITMTCTSTPDPGWRNKKRIKYTATGTLTATITCGRLTTDTFPDYKGRISWDASYICNTSPVRITPKL